MKARTFLSLLVAGFMAACGGDDKKATTNCTDDPDCGGGVCFEQACYDACAETNQCADDELCVRKDRGGEEVDLCVVAAEHAGCTEPAQCDDLLTGPCEQVSCDVGTGLCAVDALPDGEPCGAAYGVCEAGACSDPTQPACPNLSGAWTALEHCSPEMVGLVSTVSQEGCSMTSDWGGSTSFTGTVSSDGSLTVTGSTGEDILTCTGSLAGDTITMDCTPVACHVVLAKGEGATTCAAVADQFDSCGGGDLVGTWDFTRICVPDSALANEITASCPAATVTASVNWDGTLVLDSDGTCAFDATQRIDGVYTVPDSCLGERACVGLMDGNKFETTCSKSGTDCICTLQHVQDAFGNDSPPVTWATDGSSLVFAGAEGSAIKPMAFCVTGDSLTIKAPWNGGEFDLYMQLQRQ